MINLDVDLIEDVADLGTELLTQVFVIGLRRDAWLRVRDPSGEVVFHLHDGKQQGLHIVLVAFGTIERYCHAVGKKCLANQINFLR